MSTTTTTTTTTTANNAPSDLHHQDTTISSSDPLSPSRWTAPQELTLLQSLVHWKPVGLHKHFRMLAIHEALLTSGTIPHPVSEHPHASTIAGVWRKLASLYDLKALDEREDTVISDATLDLDLDSDTGGRAAEYWREFELKGFEAEMWARRLAEDGEEEEERWSENNVDQNARERERERESTVADSEDLRSSPVDAGAGSFRGGGGRRRGVGKRRVVEVMKYDGTGSGRGSSRRTSKAVSPSVDEGVEILDAADAMDEGIEEASDDEDEGSEHEEETDDGRKSYRGSGRARGGRRGRGRRGRRAK